VIDRERSWHLARTGAGSGKSGWRIRIRGCRYDGLPSRIVGAVSEYLSLLGLLCRTDW